MHGETFKFVNIIVFLRWLSLLVCEI